MNQIMDDLLRHETPPKMIAWKALEDMVIEIKFYGCLCTQLGTVGAVFKIGWNLIKNLALMAGKDLTTPNPGKEQRLTTLENHYKQRREQGKGTGLSSEDVGSQGLRTRS